MSKLKAIPMFNYMFVTCNRVQPTKSGIILAESAAVSDEQIVLKVGSTVREIQPGDTVKIDFRNYIVKSLKQDSLDELQYKNTPTVRLPVEEIDGVEVMKVPDNFISYYWKKE